MESEKLILKSSFWSFLGQFSLKLFSFIYTILLARFFTSEDVGTFYLALSVASMLFIFTDLGLDYVVSRYVPYLLGKSEHRKLDLLLKLTYFGGGFLTIIFSLLVFIFSGFIAALLNSPQIDIPLKILSFYLFVNELLAINNGILRGTKKIQQVNILASLQGFVKLILLLPLAILFGFDSFSISLGFVASFAITIPLSFLYVLPKLKEFKKNSDAADDLSQSQKFNFSKEVVFFGISTAFVVALSALLQYLDVLMLGYFNFPKSQIAIYSIAVGLANLLLIFPTSISSVFLPLISELYGKEKFDEMKKITSTTINWTILSTIPIVILFCIFGKELLSSLYGFEYQGGDAVLILFSLGLFIKSVFLIYSSIIVATRKIKSQLIIAVFSAFVNIILNFLLIPQYGIFGASIATGFSLLVYSLVTFTEAKTLFSFKFPNLYGPVLCILLLIFLGKFFASDSISTFSSYLLNSISSILSFLPYSDKISAFVFLAVLFGLCSLVYLFLLTLLKPFSSDDLLLLEKTLIRFNAPVRFISIVLRIFGKSK